MKLRTIFFILLPLLLSACSFSLAEDITPPPNYVAPTPMPTLGPLFPAEAPSLENGAVLYAEKCAACHGPQGLGDGAQGKQLPVSVAALGLPQVARSAAPADWFTSVTRGNIERYMPPFASLTDQERWDVVAYALSLHTTPEQIAHGQSVFESNCADCALNFFQDQTGMSALSADDLVLLLKSGSDQVTALKGNLSDNDLYAAAAYLRTLTFAAPTPTPEVATAAPTVASAEATSSLSAETPIAEGTPLATATSPLSEVEGSTPEAVGGKVTGSVSGGADVAGLAVTLHGFDHAADAGGPQETVTLTGVTDAKGNFVFDGLEMPENRIYVADALYQGVTYSSEFATAAIGVSELAIPPLKVYETTADYSTLAFDQTHFFIDIADGTAQVIGVYTFSNTSGKAILVQSTTEVPFLKMPADAQNIGFDISQNSAPLLAAEAGFAIPPSETPYALVAFYTLPYDGKAQIVQPFALPASSALVLVPDGVKVKSDQLTEGQVQNFQGKDYREYLGAALQSGDTLTLNLSGTPKTTGATTSADSKQNLLIGVGALGFVLILAGVWMYLRDRSRPADELDEEEEEDEFDSEEEILDAIIALDDLHRAGKIPDEAYQPRRAELKARLKT